MMTKQSRQLQHLVKVFLSMKTEDQMKDFLKGLLTAQELGQLPIRLEIVRKLKKGQAQRRIAQDLGVGIATVTRGANEIKKGRFNNVE